MASALLVLLLGETFGLWFVNTQLNIDPMRMEAANWVYQCALLSAALTITQSPFLHQSYHMSVWMFMLI